MFHFKNKKGSYPVLFSEVFNRSESPVTSQALCALFAAITKLALKVKREVKYKQYL
jgi:hypothetical protein